MSGFPSLPRRRLMSSEVGDCKQLPIVLVLLHPARKKIRVLSSSGPVEDVSSFAFFGWKKMFNFASHEPKLPPSNYCHHLKMKIPSILALCLLCMMYLPCNPAALRPQLMVCHSFQLHPWRAVLSKLRRWFELGIEVFSPFSSPHNSPVN